MKFNASICTLLKDFGFTFKSYRINRKVDRKNWHCLIHILRLEAILFKFTFTEEVSPEIKVAELAKNGWQLNSLLWMYVYCHSVLTLWSRVCRFCLLHIPSHMAVRPSQGPNVPEGGSRTTLDWCDWKIKWRRLVDVKDIKILGSYTSLTYWFASCFNDQNKCKRPMNSEGHKRSTLTLLP